MKRNLIALAFATTAMAPLAAHAQAASPAPAVDTVQEIVVTAQKRSERLQDVPVTITALSGAALTTAGVADLRSLVTLTPALRMDQTGTFTQPTIRGVGTGVTGPGANSNVGIYVDGFYQPSQIGNNFDLGNVTQVEVLKGPQGTLFGRNATGGAILITTADPSLTTASGDVSVSYRSFDDRRVDALLSTPITNDLAANLSVYGRRSNGYKTDLVTGDYTAPNDTFDVRGKLLFEPTDQFKFVLTLQHSDVNDPSGAAYDTVGNNSIAYGIPGAVVSTSRFNTAMPSSPGNAVIANAVYLKGQYSMDWATLTSYTGYRTETDKEQSQLDRTSLDAFTATWRQSERTFTEEVNLNSAKSGPLTWVTGIFYYNDKSGYPYFLFNGADGGGSEYIETQAYAPYADVTYEILRDLYLTGGVRYSNEKQTFTSSFIGVNSHTWTSVNERAVLRYEFASNTNVYASYSNGFKSGVYNTLPPANTPVNPENIDAYEVGFKTAQHNWTFNAAAYDYEYKNLQFTAYKFLVIGGVGASVAELENVPSARIYGAESQFSYKFTPDFDVNFGGAWTHGRYINFPGPIQYVPIPVPGRPGFFEGNGQTAAVSADGKTMIRTPEFTANVGANYRYDLPYGRVTLSGNLYYTTTIYFDPTDTTSQPGYAILDLRATWTGPEGKTSFSVFGNNVTDTQYVTQIAEDAFGYGGVTGTPATVGVELRTKF
jgi:iron complex outermembrane receptor protein